MITVLLCGLVVVVAMHIYVHSVDAVIIITHWSGLKYIFSVRILIKKVNNDNI